MSTRRPLVMGILNITPDSFWDGGKFDTLSQAVSRARAIEKEGADILDVGAQSTRPGAKPIGAAEETRRLIPVLKKIRRAVSIPISVDTARAEIAREALALGASIVNDTSALADPAMAPVIASAGARVILMHRKGPSATMQRHPAYRNCVQEIKIHLAARIRAAQKAGIPKKNIFVDPGIGFGKTLRHNLEILKNIRTFGTLGHPVVLGVSRKSFLGNLLGARPEDRLAGSLAAAIFAALQGIHMVRVHDVRETVHALKVLEALGTFQLNG